MNAKVSLQFLII